MPSSSEEAWRYVDLDFDLSEFAVADGSGEPLEVDPAVSGALGPLAGRAVVVDGRPVDVSAGAGDGVVFEPLSVAWRDHETEVRGAFGRGIPPSSDKFAAAHLAFGGDGVFLYVPKGAVPEGHFLVDVQATAPGSVSFPHITAVVDADSEASVVVHYNSPRNQTILVVPQIEAEVGDAARFRLTALQEFAYDTTSLARLRMAAGRDATLHLGEIGLGGKHARLHLTIDLAGSGSRGEVSGIYFGEQRQVLDYRAFMNHKAPNTSSDMFLKGAVEDEADSVFTGLIRIENEAQKTDAFQTNRNLVLSEGAAAQSVPNLEILANDVRCGHGSTVGPLDLDQRYYLMSRGLERVRADRLQVRGFFEEAIRRLPVPELADVVRRRVNAKYIAAQREGRV